MWRLFSEVPSYLAIAFTGIAIGLFGHVAYVVFGSPELRGFLVFALLCILAAAALFFIYWRWLESEEILNSQQRVQMNASARPMLLSTESFEEMAAWDTIIRNKRTYMSVPLALVPEFQRQIAEYEAQHRDT